MLTVDSKTVTEIGKESRHFSAKLVFGSKNYDEIDSFTYTSHYSPNGFNVGYVTSASVQCDIRNLSGTDLKGQVFQLMISVGEGTDDNPTEWLSLGEFKITEASVKDGVFSLTAYDKNNFISGNYLSDLSGEHTVKEVFEDICGKINETKIGFTGGFTEPSSESSLDVDNLKGYPLKDALSYLASFAARNLVVNRQGLFELRPYTRQNYGLLNDDRIETPDLNETDSVYGYVSASIDSETVLTSGDTDKSGFIFACPAMTQKRLDSLHTYFSSKNHAARSFRAGEVTQLLGDPRIEVGDVLPLNPVYDENNAMTSAECDIPVMSLVMKYDGGLMNEITAYDFEEDTSLSLAQRVDFADKSAKRVSQYATAAAEFSNIISSGLGLYKTDHVDTSGAVKTYLHDKPNLADSTYIVAFTSTGIASSNKWGGTHKDTVWTSGVDLYGNAVMKTIAANKITADLIDVTDLSALKAKIAGWSIDEKRISKKIVSDISYEAIMQAGLSSENAAFAISETKTVDGKELTTYPFRVKYDGSLTATKAEITGKITATSLTLDGCTIPYGDLSGVPLTKDDKGNFVRGTIKSDNSTSGISISSAGLLTASNAVIYGTIYASKGNIANFIIDGNYLYTGSGSKKTFLRNVSGDEHVVFAAGVEASDASGFTSTAIGNAPFYIRNDGTVKAKKGLIGGFTIGDNGLYNGKDSATSTAAGVYVGTDGIKVGTADDATLVKIYSDGRFKANSANITGEITATSGTIGGWSIQSKRISSANNDGIYSVVQSTGTIFLATGLASADATDVSKAKFIVYHSGKLVATSADINGKITATSGTFMGDICAQGGTIGGFKINSTNIITNGTTWGTSGSLILCPEGTGTAKSIGGSDEISGWVIAAGKNFGVTSAGKLYATGVCVSGTFETKENGKTTLKIDGSNIDLLEHSSQIRFKSAGGSMRNALQYNPASNYGDDVGLIIGDLGISLYVRGYMISHEQGVTGSDERIKKDIESVNSKYESFFKLLQPVTYKYIDGTSGRIHSGFIAQQVKDSAEKSGLSTQEIAAYVEYQSGKDGFGGYKCGLRYGEFVALNTHMIQKCLKEIETLKNEISILKGVTT